MLQIASFPVFFAVLSLSWLAVVLFGWLVKMLFYRTVRPQQGDKKKFSYFESLFGERRRYNLPPGPSRLKSMFNFRLLNNAHLMNVLDKWPDKYGDVVSVWFGRQRCVLLNSSRAVHESLVKRHDDFSGRERDIELKWHSGLLMRDGAEWMRNRKQTVRLLYKYGMNVRQLEFAVDDELKHLFKLWDKHCAEATPFEPREMFKTFSFNINAHAICSEHVPYSVEDIYDTNFVRVCQLSNEALFLLNEGIYAHWFPMRKWLPAYKQYRQRAVTVRRDLFNAVHAIVKGHLERFEDDETTVEEPRDLVDHFCIDILNATKEERESTEHNAVETITDVIVASVQTLPSVVHWLVYFLLTNESVQQQIFDEVRAVFDEEEQSDALDTLSSDEHNNTTTTTSSKFDRFAQLHYTRAAIAEAMRCSNMFNVIASHVTTRDTRIFQYDIPANTPCILNIHHINYSAREFQQPEVYKPERFLDAKTGVYVKPKNFLFFGAGARACLGEDFAFRELVWFVARVVLRYELLVPRGYDMPSHLDPLSDGNFVCRDYKMCVRRRRRQQKR